MAECEAEPHGLTKGGIIMAKFSVKDIMNEQSLAGLGLGAADGFRVEMVPIGRLVPGNNNPYGVRDIAELSASIEELGLLHNLVVSPADAEGRHAIISGERRYSACKSLFEAGDERFAALPCKVEKSAMAADMLTELKLIHANAMARELSDSEKVHQAGRMNEIFYKLKAEGHEFSGRMRAAVAEFLDVSDAQVGRLIKIYSYLIDEGKDALADGRINITKAYRLACLSADEQRALLAYDALEKPSKSKAEADKQRLLTALQKAGIQTHNKNGTPRSATALGGEVLKVIQEADDVGGGEGLSR